jgi:hypothetical protein
MKKIVAVILAIGLVVLASLSHFKHAKRQYTLITGKTWLVGEAVSCTFDGNTKEAHCFLPRETGTEHKYRVEVEFAEPIKYNAAQWSAPMLCRLDSNQHATCQLENSK